MIQATSNISQVLTRLNAKLKDYQDPNGVVHDKMVRAIASTAAAIVRDRVHVQGEKSDGSQIGTYSEAYMKIRTTKYKRNEGDKVIFSATRNMEKDLLLCVDNPIKTSGGYGIGFINSFSGQKADWLQNGTTSHTVPAHTRNVNGKQVKVKSYNAKGMKGFGKVYKLQSGEKVLLQKAAIEYINSL